MKLYFKGLFSCTEVDLSLNEILYILFKKKICPSCRCRLKMTKEKLDQGVGIETIVPFGKYYYGDSSKLILYYQCKECVAFYPISFLAEQQRME